MIFFVYKNLYLASSPEPPTLNRAHLQEKEAYINSKASTTALKGHVTKESREKENLDRGGGGWCQAGKRSAEGLDERQLDQCTGGYSPCDTSEYMEAYRDAVLQDAVPQHT